MNDGELRSGADQGRNRSNPTGGDGLMTSFVGWRQAFESAVMAGNDSMRRTGNVRTVNRNRRSLEHVLAGAAFGALTLGSPAIAADMPLKAPHLRPAFDWSGFYIGGHTGYSRGSSSAVLSDPLPRHDQQRGQRRDRRRAGAATIITCPPGLCSASKPI